MEVFHSFTVAPWNINHNHKRNHRRAITIDGLIGYTGGMAIKDVWLGDARSKEEWRDLMFRTTGPMVADIQGAFEELWTGRIGELLVGEKFYPANVKAGSMTYIPLSSTPSPDNYALQKFILLSILGARQNIYITTPYFLPDPSLRKALVDKAKEGVDVRILLPNEANDIKGIRYASQKYYEDLLEGGVKIYEYQPTFIHTKTISIDRGWSVIGSANMDNRSRKINEENIYGISDKAFGAAMQAVFLQDQKEAKQIELSEWKKRGLWQRLREFFALKFIQQY